MSMLQGNHVVNINVGGLEESFPGIRADPLSRGNLTLLTGLELELANIIPDKNLGPGVLTISIDIRPISP